MSCFNELFSLVMAALTPTAQANPKRDVQNAIRQLIREGKGITIGYKCEPPQGTLISTETNQNLQIYFIVKFENGNGLIWKLNYRPETVKKCTDEGNF